MCSINNCHPERAVQRTFEVSPDRLLERLENTPVATNYDQGNEHSLLAYEGHPRTHSLEKRSPWSDPEGFEPRWHGPKGGKDVVWYVCLFLGCDPRS